MSRPDYESARRFGEREIYRMFDLPLRIMQPMPTKRNARRYGR